AWPRRGTARHTCWASTWARPVPTRPTSPPPWPTSGCTSACGAARSGGRATGSTPTTTSTACSPRWPRPGARPMARRCRICAIDAGDAEAAVVLDDEHAVAFLDVRPLFPGHTLLVPRAHHETLPDLPVELVGPLFGSARRLATAVRDATGAEGTF